MATTFATIDIGSYELELTIHQITKSGIQVVDRVRKVIGLGSDTYKTGKIHMDLINDICKVLQDFQGIMKSYKVDDYRAYATSAVREARNSLRVLDQIQVRSGLKVKTGSNSEQRFLYYMGIIAKWEEYLQGLSGDCLMFDISSGSMQLSLISNQKMETTQNIRLGSLRLQEMFAGVRETTSKKNAIIRELIDSELRTFGKLRLKEKKVEHVIAINDSMADFVAKVTKGERESLTREEIGFYCAYCMNHTLQDIAIRCQMSEEKIQLLIPALMCYQIVMDMTKAKEIHFPKAALSDGVAMDYAIRQKLIKCKHDFTEDIINQARVIGARYEGNKKHSENLEKSCEELFSALKKNHGLGKREKLLLQLSAILHDCGRFMNVGMTGECSYHIIMATEIIGISHKEREMVANIVKGSTMSGPELEEWNVGMEMEENRIVMKLAAILQIAGALDRSHKQKFKDVRVSIKNQEMILAAKADADCGLEEALFETKADFFEEVYGIRPVLKPRRME